MTAVRGKRGWGLGEKFEGAKQKRETHRRLYGGSQRERSMGGGRRGYKKGQMLMEVDLTWGGEYTIQYTDDVL